MHDLSEGVAVYTLRNVIERLIKENIFSLQLINDKIETFPYPAREKGNKLRPLFFTQGKGDHELKIKQSSSEMLCLMTRYLGLMISEMNPLKNKYWKLYRCLRHIVGIITAPRIMRCEISVTYELILLLHYSRVMMLNRPVVDYSASKFETQNRRLKLVAVGTTSNVNLPITISIRHQLQICYSAEFSKSNLQTDVVPRPCKELNAFSKLKTLVLEVNDSLNVRTLKNVKILGKIFSQGKILVTKITGEGTAFGKSERYFSL